MKGINYDTGLVVDGNATRPVFDLRQVKREMQIIARDLHADTLRITGDTIEHIVTAATAALHEGMNVWFSPFTYNLSEDQLLVVHTQAAIEAEKLRKQFSRQEVVLVLGGETTLLSKDYFPGETLMERAPHMGNSEDGSPAISAANRRLAKTLDESVANARKVFNGRLTYAAGLWEDVDWSQFDIVAIDAYRDQDNFSQFQSILQEYKKWNKPVVVTEFGCCAYTGSRKYGAIAYLAALDTSTTPLSIKTSIIRDEQEQVSYWTEMMRVFSENGMAGAFWFSFAGYAYPHSAIPAQDFDVASYGMVTMREADGKSSVYEDMPWEPKALFYKVQQEWQKQNQIKL